MLNEFMRESAEELYIQLSDGRMMPLEDLIRDYERLLKGETTTYELKDDRSTASTLKVGKWFRIDREVINKSKAEIRRRCYEVGTKGKELWERFKKSNKIADKNPDQYPRLIETYIFEHSWEYKTEQQMRNMCKKIGEGMCDEIICDLELQMRLCNGESADDLFKKTDKLPRKRVIKLRDGVTGFCGGGAYYDEDKTPADIGRDFFYDPSNKDYRHTPYAFRRVLSSTERCFVLLKPKQN